MEGGPMVDANRSFCSQRNSQMEMENCTTEIKWGGEVEMRLLLNSRSSARKASAFPNTEKRELKAI